MKLSRLAGASLAALLIGSLAAGAAGAPAVGATPNATLTTITAPAASATTVAKPTATATAKPTAKSTATATAKPVTATLVVTPTTTNRGGLVTVSGAGFAPSETVTLTVSGVSGTAATAKADPKGLLPPTGVTIPYSLKPGVYKIMALGGTSKRSASSSVTVMALTPSITLSSATASPGATVTVTGKGFGSKEQVTLALNGAALNTTPAVITTTNGAFTASFAVPGSLLAGMNTVSAIGNQSRVSAVATLMGTLPVASTYYFAGGLNTASEHSFLNLLNTNKQPASVKLTFYFDNGMTDAKSVTVSPTSQKTVAVAGLEKTTGTFGLMLTADRQITAQLNINRDGRDGDALLGNTGLGTRWYLAEGYTGLTFHETVSILNPDMSAAAHVLLHLLPFGGRPGRDVPVTVAAHSTYAADVNRMLPKQSLSIIATSDRPIVVERTLTFSSNGLGQNGYGITTRAGSNTAATSWIFAEGTTVNRFQTFLTILNPNSMAALVTASFFGQTGGSLGSRTILVTPRSRANIKLNDFLSASGIASVVTSDLPVLVERPEYFGSPNDGHIAGSDVFGRNGAGVQWSFPGGNTAGNSEYLLLYNPSAVTVPVDASFYGTDGKVITKRVLVPPTVRYNIWVNDLAKGVTPVHGTVLHSANGQGFVAEQTVFAPNHATLRSTQGLAQ